MSVLSVDREIGTLDRPEPGVETFPGSSSSPQCVDRVDTGPGHWTLDRGASWHLVTSRAGEGCLHLATAHTTTATSAQHRGMRPARDMGHVLRDT